MQERASLTSYGPGSASSVDGCYGRGLLTRAVALGPFAP
jgi:hypothetical protein